MSGIKLQDTHDERSRKVFDKYSKLQRLWDWGEEDDWRIYDMSQRLKLSDIIVGDGKMLVVDLGSESGGMSYALKECGLRVVSTDIRRVFRDSDLRQVNNYNIVRCDSFHPPLKDVNALVSYMFLGLYLPEQLAKGSERKTINDIFEELSSSADTVYSVELKSEYWGLFGWKSLNQDEIRENLGNALPDWDVESLGKFGQYITEDGDTEDRLGFRFTKKRGPRNER